MNMDNFEDLCANIFEECLNNDSAFESYIISNMRSKIVAAVKDLDLTEVVQSQVENMLEYMMDEDSELYEDIKDELTELIRSKLEVKIKDESIH